MTTASLHRLLRHDAQLLKAIDAASLLFLAVIMLAVPGAVIRLVGLVGATEAGLRLAAVPWLVVGLLLAVSGRSPLGATVLAALAVFHVASSLFVLLAPVPFGLTPAPRAWFALAFLFFYLGTIGIAWLMLRVRVLAARPDRTYPSSSS